MELNSTMNDGSLIPGEPGPLQLSQRQLEVIQALQSRESEKYRLSQWYQGALYMRWITTITPTVSRKRLTRYVNSWRNCRE